MVEFVFAGIAAATLMICTVQVSISMWNYHTLAYAVHEANQIGPFLAVVAGNPKLRCKQEIVVGGFVPVDQANGFDGFIFVIASFVSDLDAILHRALEIVDD